MMEIALPRSWKEEFAFAAAMRQEDILYREKMTRFETRQRQVTEAQRIADQKQDSLTREMMQYALASPAEIKAYRGELDRHDGATVEALMEKREALEAVRQRTALMLERAHVLPDGRRVFKTTDGTQVYDEHGQQLARDVIDPDIIDNRKSRWEPYRDAKAEDARLVQEVQQLHEYQAKLDDARVRLDNGEITETELKETKADLAATMPDSVREKLGLEKPKANIAMKAEPITPSAPADLGSSLLQSGLGPVAASGPARLDRPSASSPGPS